MAEFDANSENKLATLRAKAQPWFRELLRRLNAAAAADGLTVKIISGHRTWEEQDALYAQGRTKPGNKVTNARGGQSNHNYAIAVDIGIFDAHGKYLTNDGPYAKLGPVGEAAGLEWGGRWTSPYDPAHYQLKVGKSVSQLRTLVSGSGWAALDALIADFTAPAPRPNTTPASAVEKVRIFELHRTGKAEEVQIDAWFLDSRVWVAIRDWSAFFGGDVVESGGKYELLLHNEGASIATQMIGGRAAAKFADINAILGLDYVFDGKSRPRILTVDNSEI